MNRRIAILALLLSAPAWAQIARTGSCSAAATSCTLSANAGDLVVCQGYRSGSTTAPGNPSSNTSVLALSTSSGGTTGAERLWCRKASSSSDTGSGTSTNASTVACVAYSGTAVGTTANCNTSGIGGRASNQAKASTTIDYPAITLSHTDGTSWVAGFAGDSAAAPGCPSDTSSVTAAGTAPAIRACDSAAGVTGHPDRTASVVSSTWLTAVLEIMSATVATPSYDNDSGTYNSSVNVTISDSTSGAAIVYCTDTDNTCTPSTSYSSPVAISSSGYLRSKATKTGMVDSAIKSASYLICSGNCPTLVDHFASPNTLGTPNVDGCVVTLPNPSISGNAIITWAFSGTTPSMTADVADDQGSSYTKITKAGTDGYMNAWMAVAPNTSGVHKVTWTFSPDTGYVQCGAGQFFNVATSTPDITSCPGESTGGTTSWTANNGSTCTVASSASVSVPYLVYQCAIGNGGVAQTSFAAGTGFTLASAQLLDGPAACQYRVVTAGEANPTITAGNGDGYVTIAVGVKGSTAGGAPSGIHPVHIEWNHFPAGSSSVALQFPSSGNLLVLGATPGATGTATITCAGTNCSTITGTLGYGTNAWQQISGSPNLSNQLLYAANATTSATGTLTLALGDTQGYGGSSVLYDIAGAATAPFDVSNVSTGNQTSCGTPCNLSTTSLTPTAANGLAVSWGDQGCGSAKATAVDANGHQAILSAPYWPAQDECGGTGAGDTFTLDSQAGHIFYSDTTALTFIWTMSSAAGDDWTNLAAAFKAPAAPSSARKRVLSTRW